MHIAERHELHQGLLGCCASFDALPISVHLALVCDPVTSDHLCISRNLKYNTVELCMYLHVNCVYCASYSVLRHKGISTKIKSTFFKIVEITSSKIKTCSSDILIKKRLYTHNSYLALLNQSRKED